MYKNNQSLYFFLFIIIPGVQIAYIQTFKLWTYDVKLLAESAHIIKLGIMLIYCCAFLHFPSHHYPCQNNTWNNKNHCAHCHPSHKLAPKFRAELDFCRNFHNKEHYCACKSNKISINEEQIHSSQKIVQRPHRQTISGCTEWRHKCCSDCHTRYHV